jgi:hypothetical protein
MLCKKKQIVRIILFFVIGSTAFAQQDLKVFKPLIDDATKFTTTGSIGLTISNFGTFGDGFAVQSPQDQPSCEYPRGSGIEHIFVGGLWVGAKRDNGTILVTTGARDIPSLRDVAAGFEFSNSAEPTDVVLERSSIIDNPFYSPDAVSHQDFIADFTDSNSIVPGTTIRIPQHTPMNVSVHLETYAWNFPFADAFVLFNYTIKNTGRERLNEVYISVWSDLVVRNTNITPPRVGSPFYQNVGNGWVDSLRMAYSYDFDGDPGFTDAGLYVGLKHLGATPQADDNTYQIRGTYNAWLFRDSSDPVLFSPQTDIDAYQKQQQPLDPLIVDTVIKGRRGNFMTLLTTGPFAKIDPDSSINVVFAIICGSKFGSDPNTQDTFNSRQNFYTNAFWAQTAYDGEDRNSNNQLDPGEDLDRDGEIDRYILPTPPNTPRIKVVPSDKKVTIFWDRSAEESVDFISGEMDFEGYRLYRTQLAQDLPGRDLFSSLTLVAEFDSVNTIGYDTGFDFVRLDQPVTFGEFTTDPFTGDQQPLFYHYKFENFDVLNGWQYAYSVTAFDRGDPEINLGSLESSRLSNVTRVFPGTPTREDQITQAPTSPIQVGVYPNPYRAQGAWDGNLERERKIYFYNLPADCEVRIFTLAGDLVDSFEHQGADYSGDGIQWFDRFAPDNQARQRVFAGGEHGWDLVTQDDQALASGLYFYTVEDRSSGQIQRGKFLVIK